jgi:hypothetical protein
LRAALLAAARDAAAVFDAETVPTFFDQPQHGYRESSPDSSTGTRCTHRLG